MNKYQQCFMTMVKLIEAQVGKSIDANESLADFDSIDLMELSMALELHFGLEITGSEIADLGTLDALVCRAVGLSQI